MSDVAGAGHARIAISRFVLEGPLLRILLPVVTIAATLVLWECAESYFAIPAYLVPPPSEFLGEFYSSFGEIWSNTLDTGEAILLAFLISTVVGVGLAYLIVTFPSLERGAYHLIVFLQIIPKTITAPLFIIWFGVGIVPKLALTAFIAFFPILVDSMAGFRSIEPQLYYLSRSMGASRWQTFIRIQLPAALPQIFAGLKIAAVYAVTAAIVVEFVGSGHGLGYLIVQSLGMMDMSLMFAAILATSLMGLVVSLAVTALEHVLMPWLKYR